MSRHPGEADGPDPFADLPDVDERLADWVDGLMSERDRERFEAEMRVSPRLREQVEEYERTVQTIRTALRAPTAESDVADRVMAALASEASGASRPRGARPRSPWPYVWATLSAAALLAIAIWIDAFGARYDASASGDEDVASVPHDAGGAQEQAPAAGDVQTKTEPAERGESDGGFWSEDAGAVNDVRSGATERGSARPDADEPEAALLRRAGLPRPTGSPESLRVVQGGGGGEGPVVLDQNVGNGVGEQKVGAPGFEASRRAAGDKERGVTKGRSSVRVANEPNEVSLLAPRAPAPSPSTLPGGPLPPKEGRTGSAPVRAGGGLLGRSQSEDPAVRELERRMRKRSKAFQAESEAHEEPAGIDDAKDAGGAPVKVDGQDPALEMLFARGRADRFSFGARIARREEAGETLPMIVVDGRAEPAPERAAVGAMDVGEVLNRRLGTATAPDDRATQVETQLLATKLTDAALESFVEGQLRMPGEPAVDHGREKQESADEQPRRAPRLRLGALTFEPVGGGRTEHVDDEAAERNTGLAKLVVQRDWLVEGPRDQVARLMAAARRRADATGRTFRSGEVRVVRVDRPGRGAAARGDGWTEPDAQATDRVGSGRDGDATVRIVLRFRLRER